MVLTKIGKIGKLVHMVKLDRLLPIIQPIIGATLIQLTRFSHLT